MYPIQDLGRQPTTKERDAWFRQRRQRSEPVIRVYPLEHLNWAVQWGTSSVDPEFDDALRAADLETTMNEYWWKVITPRDGVFCSLSLATGTATGFHTRESALACANALAKQMHSVITDPSSPTPLYGDEPSNMVTTNAVPP
jgi:hypothetical protein